MGGKSALRDWAVTGLRTVNGQVLTVEKRRLALVMSQSYLVAEFVSY